MKFPIPSRPAFKSSVLSVPLWQKNLSTLSLCFAALVTTASAQPSIPTPSPIGQPTGLDTTVNLATNTPLEADCSAGGQQNEDKFTSIQFNEEDGSVTVHWTLSAGSEAAESYELQYIDNNYYGSDFEWQSLRPIFLIGGDSATDASYQVNAHRYYRIVGIDGNGDVVYKVEWLANGDTHSIASVLQKQRYTVLTTRQTNAWDNNYEPTYINDSYVSSVLSPFTSAFNYNHDYRNRYYETWEPIHRTTLSDELIMIETKELGTVYHDYSPSILRGDILSFQSYSFENNVIFNNSSVDLTLGGADDDFYEYDLRITQYPLIFKANFSDWRGGLVKKENPALLTDANNGSISLRLSCELPVEYVLVGDVPLYFKSGLIGKLEIDWEESHLNIEEYDPKTKNTHHLTKPYIIGGQSLSEFVEVLDAFDHYTPPPIDAIWTITPGSGPADKKTEITFKVYMPGQITPAITETRTIEFRDDSDSQFPPPTPDYYDIPISDATGPRYRKIALNGRPLSDEAPQATAETDVAREETYIDAFSLGLQHSVTDVYVPIPGSELALSLRRNVKPQIWTDNFGLAPDEQPDLPFGLSWSSNITPHVRVVESEGTNYEGYEEPTKAYVMDENGQTFEFVQYGTSWFPMPSGSAETKAFTNTLSGTIGGDFVFSKKHGTTITFSGASTGGITIARERVEGSENTQTYTYARAVTVTDRLGYGLVYLYPPGTGLTPKEIYATSYDNVKIPGLQIYLWQDANGRVTQVRDPRGNDIIYNYGSTAGLPILSSVTFPDNSSASYTYSPIAEADQTPRNPDDVGKSPPYADPAPVPCDAFTQHIDYYHVNVASITDANNNTYGFSYTYDHTSEYYVQNKVARGNYIQTGKPMMVREVSLPIGKKVTFKALNNREGNRINASPNGGINGTRVNTVTDATGFTTTYTFSGLDIEILPQFKDIKIGQGQLSDTDPFKNPRILYYTKMEIQHGGYGKETFNFLKSAGLALASATDLSGNTTSYTYSDSNDADRNKITVPASLQTVWPSVLYTYFSDPLTERLPAVKVGASTEYYTTYFTYEDKYRIMSSIIDPKGNLTEYDIDPMTGRRTAVMRFAGSDENKTLLQHTKFLYENNEWPGFVTKETHLKVSDDSAYSGQYTPQSWEYDLVTDYSITASGRTITSTVYPVEDANDTAVNGLTTTSLYDYNGNLVWTVDPRGNKTRLDYDERNRLVTTTFHDDTTTHNVYDLRGNRVGTQDENGHYSIFKYDNLNRLTHEIRVMADAPGLNVADYTSFKAYDQLTTDLVKIHTYNAVNALTSTFEENGDKDRLTHFGYDNLQRLLFSFNLKSENSGLTEDIVTQYIYGPNAGGSVFNSETFKPTRVIDPRGFTTTFTYDALYRPTRVSVDYGNGTAVTETLYDKNSNPVVVTDSLGIETHTTYDGLNRPTQVIYAFGTTDQADIKTKYTLTGLAWSVTDELDNTTTTEYDGAGRPIKVVQPLVYDFDSTGNLNPITKTFYDAASNVSSTENPNGEAWAYTYDTRNRVSTEMQPLVFDFDASADDSPLTQTFYDNASNVIKVTDARGNESVTEYDRANRPIYSFTPQVDYWYGTSTIGSRYLATKTVYDLSSNVTEIHSGYATAQNSGSATFNRRSTLNTYDALGRLLSSEDAEGIVVANAYDASSNRIKVTDGANQITTFTYDGLGRNTSTTYGGADKTTLEYNAINQTARIDANGKRTTYEYDDRHRLTDVKYIGASNENRVYTYDAASNIKSVLEEGKDLTLTKVNYEYDSLYRITEETSNGITHKYQYDLSGNRRETVYDKDATSPRTLTSTYDALNRLDTITEGTRTTTYRYDLAGNIRRKTQGNGDTITKTFDKLNRCATITGPGTGGSELYICTNTFDLYGNLGKMVETYPGGQLTSRTCINTYDAANRLTKESITTGAVLVTTDYTYDDAHNRTLKKVTDDGVITQNITYNYGTNNKNQIESYSDSIAVTTTNLTYDNNGNRISKSNASGPDTLYYYDRENRLIELVTDTEHDINIYAGENSSGTPLAIANYSTSGTQSRYLYAYDYRTRRVLRDESGAGGEKAYIIFSGGTSIQEYEEDTTANIPGFDSSDDLLAEYIRGSDYGGGVGGILYSLRSSVPSYYHYNGRGDVTAKTDSASAITYQAAYEAFGKHGDTASSESWGTNVDRQQANTKDEDPTGLLNEGFRYRDLETGTFITRDPLGFVDGPNVYTYVMQNPWTKFDPLGLSLKKKILAPKAAYDAARDALKQTGKINGRRVINSQWAGDVRPFSDVKGGAALQKKYGGAGVKYTDEGLGDFSAYAKNLPNGETKMTFDPGVLEPNSGNYKGQATAQLKEMGLSNDQIKEMTAGHTWHHAPDGNSLELVPTDLHKAFAHTGGSSIGESARDIASKGLAVGGAVGGALFPNTAGADGFWGTTKGVGADVLQWVDPGFQDVNNLADTAYGPGGMVYEEGAWDMTVFDPGTWGNGGAGDGSNNWEDRSGINDFSCCFIAGTQITMSDGSMKSIEDVVIGDKVLSWNENTNQLVEGEVESLISPIQKQLVTLDFGNAKTVNTLDHPFYVKSRGWCSVKPDLTKSRYEAFQDLAISDLRIGDTCYQLVDGKLIEVILSDVKMLEEENIQTYNFRVAKYHTYIANGILVHNK